jgi:uncharacterized membrane protein (DUF4010 family)
MEESNWYQIFISLGLGMLVGLQRESVDSKTAGIRTFPLVSLMGTLTAMMAQTVSFWIIAAGLIAVAAILVTSNLHRMHEGAPSPGITTEVAVILMYVVGAYLTTGNYAIAVVVTGIITVLLHFKATLHGWVDKIGQKDLLGIMQFILISMVILPVLPDETYDRYDSINPKEIWWMVVLIVGIGLVGYFLFKIFGQKAGVLLGGILGGLISSTATTLSYAKKARTSDSAAKLAAFVILTASLVSMVRVLVEISVVAPEKFVDIAIPLGALLAVTVALVVLLFFRHRNENNKMPDQENPAQLKSAVTFALLYAAIRFITAWASDEFGNTALYPVAVVSGLTDMDAITLSTSQLAEQNRIETGLAWRLIIVATMSNLVFKGAMAAVLGGMRLGRLMAVLFGVLIIAGFAIIFLWPAA